VRTAAQSASSDHAKLPVIWWPTLMAVTALSPVGAHPHGHPSMTHDAAG
jgi:hypothetical protein